MKRALNNNKKMEPRVQQLRLTLQRIGIATAMSMFSYSYYLSGDIPTLGEVKNEIPKIVGQPDVKAQLSSVLDKIVAAEKQACLGFRVVPPKPFHLVFVGNSGTGKSLVARILGRLFFLAGVLPSFGAYELLGDKNQIKAAKGGILVVDVDRNKHGPEIVEEIESAIDERETSVIFSGSRQKLNRFMSRNKRLYQKTKVKLQFDDLSCEELAKMLQNKINGLQEEEEEEEEEEENNLMMGGRRHCRRIELHRSCTIEKVGQMIAKETNEETRSMLNGHLIEPILTGAKSNLKCRVGLDDQSILLMTLEDLQAGLRTTDMAYKRLLGLM